MRYERMLGFAQHWLGKIIVFAVIVLFLWHAALRIFHLLHDFGIRTGTGAKATCFGLPLLCTIATAFWLLILGF
jgi:fumarate reductase subunit D